MDYQVLSQIVSNLGFPIVVCGALFWFLNKTQDKHSEEMKGFQESINNNTNVMQKLLDRMGENKGE